MVLSAGSPITPCGLFFPEHLLLVLHASCDSGILTGVWVCCQGLLGGAGFRFLCVGFGIGKELALSLLQRKEPVRERVSAEW